MFDCVSSLRQISLMLHDLLGYFQTFLAVIGPYSLDEEHSQQHMHGLCDEQAPCGSCDRVLTMALIMLMYRIRHMKHYHMALMTFEITLTGRIQCNDMLLSWTFSLHRSLASL